jgi:hypothetical protein
MTEGEAKGKWCPFAIGEGPKQVEVRNISGDTSGQTVGVAVSSINRAQGGSAHADCKCLGSECMSWVWRSTAQDQGFCSLLDQNRQQR